MKRLGHFILRGRIPLHNFILQHSSRMARISFFLYEKAESLFPVSWIKLSVSHITFILAMARKDTFSDCNSLTLGLFALELYSCKIPLGETGELQSLRIKGSPKNRGESVVFVAPWLKGRGGEATGYIKGLGHL